MSFAVLLLSCSDTPRVTSYDQAWVHKVVGHVAGYLADQSAGREQMEFRVFDWFQLPMTGQQWNDLGFGAGPKVTPLVESGLHVDLRPFDHFALVIDKFGASSAAVSPTFPTFVHVGAQSLDPALLAHELGHFLGASHANLDTPAGPREYDDQFCIMGREGTKYSHVYPPLNLVRPDGTINVTLSDSGPGMVSSTLRAVGWLDLAQHGVDITTALGSGTQRTTVQLAPLRGAPPRGPARPPVCAYARGVVAGQLLLLEYRHRDGEDLGLPAIGEGYVLAHLTGQQERSPLTLLVGSSPATAGASFVTSQGAVRIGVIAASSSAATLDVEVMGPVPVDHGQPDVVSWGADRLDLVGRGVDKAAFHKAWAGGWYPSQAGWEALGGGFTGPLSMASWGPDRLDLFAAGLDSGLWHKAWAQGWFPSQNDWEALGGRHIGKPAVTSWGPERLDIFTLGQDRGVHHKAWAQGWFPSQDGWEDLGGRFITQPAVASWGPGRLDVFGVGLDKAMFHKAWDNGWWPTPQSWEFLGGGFTSPPAVCSWGPERLDIFALGLDGSMWHKAWAQGWFPSQNDWEPIGGKFLGAPAVTSWGPDRIDIFGVGLDGGMYHKAWAQGWFPSQDGWEALGGTFASPPTVTSWGPGRLDVFALGKDYSMWHKAWADGWSPGQDSWESIGGRFL